MTSDGSSSVRNETVGRAPRRPVDRRLHDLVEPELARRDVGLLAARELDELADERRHRLELVLDVGEQLRALARSSAPGSASSPMFARRVAIGVRSSCEASATSCRCVRSDASRLASSSSSRVESRLISSRPAPAGPLAQIAGLDDPLGRLGQPPQRRNGPAGDERAEQRRGADPAERDEDEQPLQMGEVAVDLDAASGRS